MRPSASKGNHGPKWLPQRTMLSAGINSLSGGTGTASLRMIMSEMGDRGDARPRCQRMPLRAVRGERKLHFSMTADSLNDFADRRCYIVRRFKVHVVPAVDDDLSAVG
jgi:hypothetical protein